MTPKYFAKLPMQTKIVNYSYENRELKLHYNKYFTNPKYVNLNQLKSK